MKTIQLELPFATRYNPPPSPVTPVGGESLTHVECAKECDINYIMSRYTQTGVMPSGNRLPLDGAIMDSVGSDFQANMDRMVQARQEFEQLPAKLRDRFGNDPAKLVAFLSDTSNREEAIKLGLVEVRARAPEQQGASNHAPAAESGTREDT